jgi:hypothetical protein
LNKETLQGCPELQKFGAVYVESLPVLYVNGITKGKFAGGNSASSYEYDSGFVRAPSYAMKKKHKTLKAHVVSMFSSKSSMGGG